MEEQKQMMDDQREKIYRSVVNCTRDNTLEMLDFKIQRLKTIIGYKDARQLLEECDKKVKKLKRRQKTKKVFRIILTILDFALIIGTIILCIFLLRRHTG